MFAPGVLDREVDSLFSLDGWTDAKPMLVEESKKLKPWTFAIHPDSNEDAILSAPEVFDPKTDVGCLETVPLKELLARKTIVPAASLSETEIVDLFDALLTYQSMFMRSETVTYTLFTCAYLHQLSLTEGNKAVKAMCRAVLKNIETVINVVVNANLRDGDEEFIPTTYDVIIPEESVDTIIAEVDAAIAGASDAIKPRLALQRSLLAVINGMTTVHQYAPNHPPAAVVANEEKKKKLEEQRKAAKEAAKESKEAAAAAAAAAADEPPTSDSLPFYTKEELDAFRPKVDVPALIKAFSAAVNAWHRAGNTEPAKTEKVFTKYAPTWMSVVSPSKFPEMVPLANAKQYFKELASNFTAINQWKNMKIANNWYLILNSLKAFAANNSGIVARSVGILFLYNPQIDLVLDARSVSDIIVHTLDIVHGSPLYKAMYYEYHDAVNAIAQSKYDKIPEKMRKMSKTPAAVMIEGLKTQLVSETRGLIFNFSKTVFSVMHTLLKSRGGCHIGFRHVVGTLSNIWQEMGQFETAIFGTAGPQAPQQADPKTAKHFVLANFASELLSEAIDIQFNNEINLELLSKPEAAAFAVLRYSAIIPRIENAANLFVDVNALASGATNKGAKGLKNLIDSNGAAHAFRQAKPAPINVLRVFDVTRNACNATFMVLTALREIIPGSVQPEYSLTSTATVFDNRFAAYRANLPPGYCPRYIDIAKTMDQMSADPVKSLDQAAQLMEHFTNSTLKKHVENAKDQPLPIATTYYEKVVKHNLGTVKAATALIRAGSTSSSSADLKKIFADWVFDFEYVQGYPQLVKFNLAKKQ